MNTMNRKIFLTLCLIILAVVPQSLFAATTAAPIATGIAFQIDYVEETSVYEVSLISSETPEEADLTLTAQVTLKVPHSADTPFTVSNLTSAVDGTVWTLSSRINAPDEDPTADYLSFTVEFPEGKYDAFEWVADQAVKAFEFQSETGCMGVVALMDDGDAFAQLPNSENTNPGNQIDVLYLSEGNLYSGIAGTAADCAGRNLELNYDYYLPLMLH